MQIITFGIERETAFLLLLLILYNVEIYSYILRKYIFLYPTVYLYFILFIYLFIYLFYLFIYLFAVLKNKIRAKPTFTHYTLKKNSYLFLVYYATGRKIIRALIIFLICLWFDRQFFSSSCFL